ncbi:MAG TPA: TMEM175 family protein [Allosphingosinicella sp.]|nr:TMEM175 family protein [Allosphingosinicella sp.]
MQQKHDPQEAPRLDDHPGEGAVRGTQRMEIFADAVFAIAFTLPLVELKMPEPGPGFTRELLALWPQYLGYALSALVIGLYWVHHHFSGAVYRTTGHHFLLATLLFLALIGFIAFPTRAFAEHLHDPYARETGAIVYTCTLAAIALAWLIKWKTGCATGDVDDRLDEAYVARLTRKYQWTTALMAAAAALSFLRWEAGLALAAAVTLYQLRAPETPVYTERAPTVEGED